MRYSVWVRGMASPLRCTVQLSVSSVRSPMAMRWLSAAGAAAQNGLDAHQQLRVGKGLDDIVVGAGGKAHHLIRLAGVGGEEHDGRVKALADAGGRHNAVELGHIHVQKVEVDVLRSPVGSCLTVCHGDDVIALAAQQQFHDGEDLRLIIGDEDTFRLGTQSGLLSCTLVAITTDLLGKS